AALGMIAPRLHNWIVTNRATSRVVKRLAGFAPERSLPVLPRQTVRRWYAENARHCRAGSPDPAGLLGGNRRTAGSGDSALQTHRRVHLFCDEFTNFHDAEIGVNAVRLLERLGYEVVIPEHVDSGRAQLSKGFVREARRLAIENVKRLAPVITD